MSEINKYYLSLLQEIRTMQDTAENGASQEQLFTQIALEMLAEAFRVRFYAAISAHPSRGANGTY